MHKQRFTLYSDLPQQSENSKTMDKSFTLSVISPIYFNEQNLPHTLPKFLELRDLIPSAEIEFIFVVDGSPDNSLDILLEFKRDNENIKIIKFTKNFGAMSAAIAGIEHSTGDCVTVVGADLQDPPELLVDMVKKWQEGYKTVLAIREDRDEPWHQKLISNTYYSLFRKLAIGNYPKMGYDLFLIDRQVVTDLLTSKEKNIHLQNAIFSLGYDFFTISYTRQKRQVGKSRWTLSKKIKLFIDSIISYSYIPIRAMTILGLTISLSSFVYGIYIFIFALLGKTEVEGWATLIILMTFLQGTLMMMVGILGEYIWRTFDEVRNRKPFIIDKIYD